jgi:hypothetical protein
MRHLDTVELVRCVAGEGLSEHVTRHAESCPSCRIELCRLGSGVSAVRAPASVAPASAPECLDDFAISAFADASLEPPEREIAVAHLARCERCRVAVSSVTSALAGTGMAAVISGLERTRRPGRFLAVSAGLVGVAVVAGLLLGRSSPVQNPVQHRDGAGSGGAVPVTISPEGPSRSVQVLRWHSVTGADRYRVTVFEEDGSVLYEAVVTDTMAALPDTIDLEPGRSFYWLVSARTDFDRWSTSALAEFSVGGAP